ncbi:agmatine deiminase family protein [Candidatus Sulfidibacterium hydrothermale]|uniref:agmatine deiminase family protein n=1 Tax=Candidatus Sulfidibacterium hydrothermale TaxID=2875962 RepID=UPI001F0A62F7|nr:agmatine deiminase family protein [Candidatus Sulfidibacterium hydrothermale]UBM61546.1 agmatine deiminase family protein [Candidatus Sulfidibacterium hydrothermale]
MITDFETNTIYFSERLKTDKRFTKTFKEITSVLKSIGIEPKLLPKTKDIWARDYMPIQVTKEKFIEYRYDPDYLQKAEKGYRNLKSYPDIVCDLIQLTTEKSDIILDGGNVVKSNNCLILTDKVVVENRLSYSKTELIKKLKRIFKVEKIILIPWDKKERFGHSDGVLRFINSNTVLISEIYEYDTKLLYNTPQKLDNELS